MNKKANTVVFMLGATVVNVLMMIVIMVALLALIAAVAPTIFQGGMREIILIVILLGSVALTYFLYNRLIKWMSKKWNLEEHFDPIFGRRGGKKPE